MQFCSWSGAFVSLIAQTPSLREQILRCKNLDHGGDSSLVLVTHVVADELSQWRPFFYSVVTRVTVDL